MNILFVIGTDWFETASSDWHRLAEGLAGRGHKVFAIDHRPPRYGFRHHRVYESLDIPGVSLVSDNGVHLRRPGFVNGFLKRPTVRLSHGRAMARAIRGWQIDVVVVYPSPVNGRQALAQARRSHIPVAARVVWELPEREVYRQADVIFAAMDAGADVPKVRRLRSPQNIADSAKIVADFETSLLALTQRR